MMADYVGAGGAILAVILGALINVFRAQLKRRDDQQERDIQYLRDHVDSEVGKLWSKYEQLANSVTELRLHVEGQHYKRGELDVKFEKLDVTFKRGFEALNHRFDEMNKSLLHFMSERPK